MSALALTYCEVCRLPFHALRADARLCSPTCRQRASRARREADRRRALDLLREASTAIAAGGDLLTLAEIAAEADRLLGAEPGSDPA